MARKYYDNVRHLVSTTGTSDIGFGAVPAGWQGLAAAGAVDGDEVPYELREGNNWENGYLTLSSSISVGTRVVEDSSEDGDPIDLQGVAVFTITLIGDVLVDHEAAIAAAAATANAAIPASYLDTDVTLAANSDTKVATQKAVKTLVAALSTNMGSRQRVRVMDTTNSDPATSGYTNGATIDGVTVATGNLVFRNSASNTSRNGVWVVAASGAASRAALFAAYDDHPGSLIAVEEGTAGADTIWLCTSNVGGTLNSTAIVFFQVPLTGGAFLAVAQTFTAKQTIAATLKLQQALEKVTVTADNPASGDNNFDVLTQAIQRYTTNTDTNWTINVRGDGSNSLNSIMAVDEAITIVVEVVNGSTAYYMSGFKIDGNAVTPKYLDGTAFAAGNASATDTYTFTIIKTASAVFKVLAQLTKWA